MGPHHGHDHHDCHDRRDYHDHNDPVTLITAEDGHVISVQSGVYNHEKISIEACFFILSQQ